MAVKVRGWWSKWFFKSSTTNGWWFLYRAKAGKSIYNDSKLMSFILLENSNRVSLNFWLEHNETTFVIISGLSTTGEYFR
jgi:hypothetical protein